MVEAVQHFLFGIAIDESFKGPQANTLAWDVLYPEQKTAVHGGAERKNKEDRAAFGDAVRVLADKAYPELAENARERLALNQFLEQIENSQVAFSVKQKRPRNVEEAATAVIELESYLRSTPNDHAPAKDEPQSRNIDGRDSLTATMKSLCERLQRVEVLIGEIERLGNRGASKPTRENDDGKLGADSIMLGNVRPSVVRACHMGEEDLLCDRHGGSSVAYPKGRLGTNCARNLAVPLQMQSCPLQQNPIELIVKEKIVIPAASEVELMVDLATPVAKGTWVVAGNTSARHGVMVAHAVVCPNAKPVPVRMVNPREEIVVLKKGTEIAHMELQEQDPVIETSTVAEKFNISREDQSMLWEMVSRVGDDVNKDEKE
eukprot:Em0003g936a